MKSALLAALAVIGIAAPANASEALQLKYLTLGNDLSESALQILKALGPTRACAQLSAAVDAYAMAYKVNPDKAGHQILEDSVDIFISACPEMALKEVQ